MISRRLLLQRTLLAAAGSVVSRSWAVPGAAGSGRLIFVFLRGGCDSLSALVPHGEAFYYEVRPGIAIARPDAADPDAVVALDAQWGLHPVLAPALKPIWDARQLAIVPFAGAPVMSRSHFEAQDLIEAGLGPAGRPGAAGGFLNRLLVELRADASGVAFTPGLPLAMRGARPVGNSPLRPPGGMPADESFEELAQRMYEGHRLQETLRDGLGLRREVVASMAAEMAGASRQAPGTEGFAAEGSRLGRFLRERREYAVSFVEVGGWDTHVGQGGASGVLAGHLRRLGRGLASLATELGPEWDRTAVVVLSEFGRTFRENGNRGTDHGRGSAMWLLGGAVAGGRIVGEQVRLRAETLNEGRDLPVLDDYRAVLAELVVRLFGIAPEAVTRVFPGVTASPGRFGLV